MSRCTTRSLAGFSLASRYLSRHSATAYSMRSSRSAAALGKVTRISVQVASAIQPRSSSSRQGTSYFLGPIKLNTSPSRPSSRTSVAVKPSRRRA